MQLISGDIIESCGTRLQVGLIAQKDGQPQRVQVSYPDFGNVPVREWYDVDYLQAMGWRKVAKTC